jgi:hypothetical protein
MPHRWHGDQAQCWLGFQLLATAELRRGNPCGKRSPGDSESLPCVSSAERRAPQRIRLASEFNADDERASASFPDSRRVGDVGSDRGRRYPGMRGARLDAGPGRSACARPRPRTRPRASACRHLLTRPRPLSRTCSGRSTIPARSARPTPDRRRSISSPQPSPRLRRFGGP